MNKIILFLITITILMSCTPDTPAPSHPPDEKLVPSKEFFYDSTYHNPDFDNIEWDIIEDESVYHVITYVFRQSETVIQGTLPGMENRPIIFVDVGDVSEWLTDGILNVLKFWKPLMYLEPDIRYHFFCIAISEGRSVPSDTISFELDSTGHVKEWWPFYNPEYKE